MRLLVGEECVTGSLTGTLALHDDQEGIPGEICS